LYRFRHIFLTTTLFLVVLSDLLTAQAWKNYPYTPEGSLVSFPADEGWHPEEEIEWWYMAGHLVGTTSSTPYSFMLTYFYYPSTVGPYELDGFRILNISNDQTGVFHTETMALNYVDQDTTQMHIDARLLNSVSEHWFHKEEPGGTLIPFEYELESTAGMEAITLSTVSLKPPLIPGGDGLFDQGASSYTYYYSLTESLAEGTLTFEGISEEVTGSVWIDRQYGNFNPNTGEKYEWFYLQLSNGMDLNIWNLFTPEGQLPDIPAYRHISVYADEETQYTLYDFELQRLSWATLPLTGNCYAQEWRLISETGMLDLTISTLHHNSEVELPFSFFEGTTTASGSVNGTPVTGVGFAELLKHYDPPLFRITRPTELWNENFPILWEVQNPDDGRPLLFDLAYGTSGEGPWNPFATGIADTFCYWNDHPFENGDSCWFRIDGYTADKTLLGSCVTARSIWYDDRFTSLEEKGEVADGDFFALIYPNPAGKWLWVQTSLTGELSCRILDLTGRLLFKGALTGEGMEIGFLEKGVYLLILEHQGIISVQRFIKE
jgi:predicted secreted hydrolase